MAELIQCPECRRHLKLPESLMGQSVKCPSCGEAFTAPELDSSTVGASFPPDESMPSDDPDSTASTSPSSPFPAFDDEPRHSPPSYDLDDYDDDYRRQRRLDCASHRGPTILVMGILSLVCCGVIFGPIAWIMGNNDMAQIRSGYMDPAGEGMTQAGRVCGIVGTIKEVIGTLLVCLAAVIEEGGRF